MVQLKQVDLSFIQSHTVDEIFEEIEIKTSLESKLTILAGRLLTLEVDSLSNFKLATKQLAVLSSPSFVRDIKNETEEVLLQKITELLTSKLENYAENKVEPSFNLESSPIKALEFLMKKRNVDSKDLENMLEVTGQHIRNILKGERNISKKCAKILGEKFKVDPNVFIQKIKVHS